MLVLTRVPGAIRQIQVRFLRLGGIRDPQEYLRHCSANGISLDSTVFRGTLYELTSKQALESVFHCEKLTMVGGSYDNGIDIMGKWRLHHLYIRAKELFPSKVPPTTSLLRRSIEYDANVVRDKSVSLQNDISILVQCKNFTKRIGAQTIRELSGIYDYHVKGREAQSTTFLFLVSPAPLTPQAVTHFNSLKFPALHIMLSSLKYDETADIYDIRSWNGGNIENVYLNPVAQRLLAGLNPETQLRYLTK